MKRCCSCGKVWADGEAIAVVEEGKGKYKPTCCASPFIRQGDGEVSWAPPNNVCYWCGAPPVVDTIVNVAPGRTRLVPFCGKCRKPNGSLLPEPKPDYNMMPPRALRAIAMIFTTCAKGRPHWVIDNIPQTSDITSAMRHLEAHRAGEYISEEGHAHLAHVASRILMALEKMIANGPEPTVWNGKLSGDSPAKHDDDRPAREPAVEPAGGGGIREK